MKEMISAIRKSKYHKLISGTLFAILAFPFFIWGISIIILSKGTYLELVIALLGIVICLISGLYSMFRKDKTVKAAC
ncbi:hypothetical protein Ana3638_17475 [Anaerocolumna sedimenticola]|uniref:Uncharacterized protein n=1 Tax=Anaerocolumna sedimenticola TaxID=2696063 RepID=A0A6P1TPH4_9FIRM|nr:hypothetical protein [Anaerocolumna sedimenticola]QHQ62353.1 hypothetical protein Ana3638_17475 [Anaerocolumna sedimenticola]